MTKTVKPGAIALPRGHLEVSASPEDTLYRDLHEELGVIPSNVISVYTLRHRSQEFRKIHYNAVQHWTGEITNHEADAGCWVPFDTLDTFDRGVDRVAIREYRRVYDVLR